MNARPPASAVVWLPRRQKQASALSPALQAFRDALLALPDSADPALLKRILATEDAQEIAQIRRAAEERLLAHCGDTVRLRGLIEFSNRCVCDCHYCGIRRGNRTLQRYSLSLEQILRSAQWCAQQGYGSVVLQAGERRDAPFVDFVEQAVRQIKAGTQSEALPQGLGITLCVGEQDEASYRRWFEAGAHRYLLRMESFSPALFAALHPPTQTQAGRLACLHTLQGIGYQVGTGVMIGLPAQSLDDLVGDLLAFRTLGVDMLGMGPYIPHADAPLPGAPAVADPGQRMRLALRMIAAARLLMPDINIAATTALQALAEDGREQGLQFGANVIMPQVTPPEVRQMYTLYDGKPCLDDNPEQCAHCVEGRIHSVGRRVLRQAWGDSPHYDKRLQGGLSPRAS
jgi:biotin synthase